MPCQGLGGLAHAVEHGQAALLVEVQADAQADLVGVCILLEGFHQREYGVAGVGGTWAKTEAEAVVMVLFACR